MTKLSISPPKLHYISKEDPMYTVLDFNVSYSIYIEFLMKMVIYVFYCVILIYFFSRNGGSYLQDFSQCLKRSEVSLYIGAGPNWSSLQGGQTFDMAFTRIIVYWCRTQLVFFARGPNF